LQGAPYCILPEEDLRTFCQVIVDKDIWGGMTYRWDRPQWLEVPSELGIENRSIPCGGCSSQKFVWNTQWFHSYEFKYGRLQILFIGRAPFEEDEGRVSIKRS
jgi:hypothetical protein